jgi:hypothetical protein
MEPAAAPRSATRPVRRRDVHRRLSKKRGTASAATAHPRWIGRPSTGHVTGSQTVATGNATEAIVRSAFHAVGFGVYTADGDGYPVDTIVTCGPHLVRVQVKTARRRGKKVEFNTSQVRPDRSGRVDYRGRIDLFAAYEPLHGDVLLVPVDEAPVTVFTARDGVAANNQQRHVRQLDDYRIERYDLPALWKRLDRRRRQRTPKGQR